MSVEFHISTKTEPRTVSGYSWDDRMSMLTASRDGELWWATEWVRSVDLWQLATNLKKFIEVCQAKEVSESMHVEYELDEFPEPLKVLEC